MTQEGPAASMMRSYREAVVAAAAMQWRPGRSPVSAHDLRARAGLPPARTVGDIMGPPFTSAKEPLDPRAAVLLLPTKEGHIASALGPAVAGVGRTGVPPRRTTPGTSATLGSGLPHGVFTTLPKDHPSTHLRSVRPTDTLGHRSHARVAIPDEASPEAGIEAQKENQEISGNPNVPYMEPPKFDNYKSDCFDKVRGSSSCNFWAHDIKKSFYNFGHPEGGYEGDRESVKIQGATDTEYSLVKWSWSLLQDNIDLVYWAACWVWGYVHKEFESHIFGLHAWSNRIEVRFEDDCEGAGHPMAFAFAGDGAFRGDNLTFCRNGAWCVTRAAWDSGDSGTQLCAAIGVASTIAHEIAHIVGYMGRDCHNNTQCSCDRVYMFHYTIQYALLMRYFGSWKERCLLCQFPSKATILEMFAGDKSDTGSATFGDQAFTIYQSGDYRLCPELNCE